MLDFVCVGPQRTGTTWLDASLRRHPHVCLPEGIKETMYYDRRSAFMSREKYARFFAHCAPGQLVGEVSPSYFHDADAAKRLHADAPNARILIMLRDPTQKTHSLFLHHHSKGRVPRDLARAIEAMPEIVDSARYTKYVPMWIDLFGRENVHLVFFEDIAARPQELVAEISSFLGVPAPDAPEPIRERVYARTKTAPRSLALARAASWFATRLHDLGLHRVVAWGKRLGLNRVYSGGEQAMPALSEDDRRLLDGLLREEHEFLDRMARSRTEGRG